MNVTELRRNISCLGKVAWYVCRSSGPDVITCDEEITLRPRGYEDSVVVVTLKKDNSIPLI